MASNTDNKKELDEFQTEDNTKNSTKVLNVQPELYDKSQSLVDIANNTFKELCRTLENEQSKLLELEERRKKLQEEMIQLKQEIEEEKHSYRLNLVESLTDNAEAMCAKEMVNLENSDCMETDEGSQYQNTLYTCYETDEVANGEEVSAAIHSIDDNDSKHPNDIANSIQRKLQGVVAECVIEQCNYVDTPQNDDSKHTS